MFSKEDILARMHKGESIEDIATAMSNTLNEAGETFQKEEEAKVKKAEQEAQKLADLQGIIDLIHDFCIDYYCDNNVDIDTVHNAFATLDAESVNKMIEEAGAYAARMTEMQKHLDSVFGGFFGTPKIENLPKKGTPAPKARTADTIIEDFLSSMGL